MGATLEKTSHRRLDFGLANVVGCGGEIPTSLIKKFVVDTENVLEV